MSQDIFEGALERASLILVKTGSGNFPQQVPFFCVFYHVIYMSMPFAEGAGELVQVVRVHSDAFLAEVVTLAVFPALRRDSVARRAQELWFKQLLKWHPNFIREALEAFKEVPLLDAHLCSWLPAVQVSASNCLLGPRRRSC